MADLTTMVAWTCNTNGEWSTLVTGSKGDKYVVRFGRLNERNLNIQGCQYGWTCTCKGFTFRGTCSHVATVKASGVRCGWNACLEPTLDCGTDTNGERSCPDCGAGVHALQVGV